MITNTARGMCFRNGLLGRPGQSRHHRDRPAGPGGRRHCRQFEHRSVHADVADRELRGVHPDGQAPCAGVEVIARQRPLMPGIEFAVGIEGQRVRRKHGAVGDQLADLVLDFAMVHERSSYPNSGPATANGSCAGEAMARPRRIR